MSKSWWIVYRPEDRGWPQAHRCRSERSTKAPETVASDQSKCRCAKGYQWNQNQTGCVRAPTAQEVAAENNRICREKYGAGYYAGKPNANGQFDCRPTKKAAIADCLRTYGKRFIRVIRQGNQYLCEYSTGSGGRQPTDQRAPEWPPPVPPPIFPDTPGAYITPRLFVAPA